MKKFLILVVFFFLSVSSVVFAVERGEITETWQERKDGVTTVDWTKNTSILIPTFPSLSAIDGVATLTRKEHEKNLMGTEAKPGPLRSALNYAKSADKNSKIAADNSEVAATAATNAEKNSTEAVKKAGDAKDVSLGNRTIMKKFFDSLKGWQIATLIAVLFIGIFGFWRQQRNTSAIIKKVADVGNRVAAVPTLTVQAVGAKLDLLEKKIDAIPAETAKAVKALEPITIDFTVRGKNVSYTPPIVNGSYLSLYVPKTVREEVDDPSRIIRLPIDNRGKMYKSTLEIVAAFLDGEFNGSDIHSRQQKELIRFAQAIGQLKIS